ncbi:phosphatidylserine decarboxylase [Sungkyunkwania multivorans]|uniref:Phosphatidylserine decarboxylase n=1 Tax=Sungkyunkwania multivorans TaxID=1173618 RepID=A0ABW3CWA2_9FLAO
MNDSIAYYSDPYFKVFKVPQWRATLYRFLSVKLWGNIPSPTQRKISRLYSSVYDKPISKHIIKPYIRANYSDKQYLEKFKPPFGKTEFESFQDFFIREFREMPTNSSDTVWPCEGLLCDVGKIRDIATTKVKCDERYVHTVFGVAKGEIPRDYTFTNVFLHNKNYHRIHAPVTGTITRIQHIPGDLVILRPWIYKQNPSLPAFRNERVNIDITDSHNRVWYISIVGGPAVGTIELPEKIRIDATIKQLDEIAMFYLGSTCCIAAPKHPCFHQKNTFVEVGASY